MKSGTSSPRRKATTTSPAKASRLSGPAHRNAAAASEKEDFRLLTERVKLLEGQNAGLKSQLRDLRRAAASTTKVLKAPTTFVELKKEESSVKLPPIALPKREHCDHSRYENEIQRLKDSIEDLKELHLIQIEQLKGQLNEKIAKAMEHSADLNRLQNLCRQLQAEQDRHKRTPPTPVPPAADLSGRVRELEQQVRDYQQLCQTMQSALTDAERTAASCAQIAKVKDEQCQQLQSDLDAQRKRQKETMAKLFDVTERAQRERDKFDDEIRAAKDRAREFQDMLKILKAAWSKRESEWLAYDQERNDKWKAEAAKWMSTASTKLDELKAGSALLQEMTLRKGASGAAPSTKSAGTT